MPGRWWAAGLVGLAVAARVAAVLVLQSHLVPRSTFEHGEIAANLLAGRGFAIRFLGVDGPTSQQAPLYPMVVAAAYAAGGVETPRALLGLELGQAVLGGLLVLAVLALAREIVPDRPWAGRFAGLVAALYPTLVYSATHVQVAGLAATLLMATLAMAYRAGRTGRSFDVVLTGLALGLLILTDPILGLVAPGAAWAMARGRGWGLGGLRAATVCGLAAGLCVTPWVVRNYRVHGAFVPVKSTFGYAFWQGNCALSQGTDKVVRASVERALERRGAGLAGWNRALWEARHEAGYIDDIALTRADYAAFGRMSEPERSRVLFRRALADLRAEPGRYAALCLKRLRMFVLFDETNPKTRHPIYRAAHLGLTGGAAIGLLLLGGRLRRSLGPTILTAGLISAFHALTIVSARFHVPLEPLLGLWAACGIDRAAGWIAAARGGSTAAADDVVGVGVEGGLLAVHRVG